MASIKPAEVSKFSDSNLKEFKRVELEEAGTVLRLVTDSCIYGLQMLNQMN